MISVETRENVVSEGIKRVRRFRVSYKTDEVAEVVRVVTEEAKDSRCPSYRAPSCRSWQA